MYVPINLAGVLFVFLVTEKDFFSILFMIYDLLVLCKFGQRLNEY